MKLLLLTGFGPVWPASSLWDSDTLAGTFFDRKTKSSAKHIGLGRALGTADFRYRAGSGTEPLFRPRLEGEPHLTTATLVSILDAAGVDYEVFRLEEMWSGAIEPALADPDVVALSTTFICNWRAMTMAAKWVRERYPNAHFVVGGQYSNLKYTRIMRDLPGVDFIVRGDAEVALPMLLSALEGRADLGKVPNLVRGERGGALRRVHLNDYEYIDLEAQASPSFRGKHRVVPYESMRGCPFSCKFCSFPAASPKWRYKSSEKICKDWATYAEVNGASVIRALDSTFTVPPGRLMELLEKLPSVGVPWDAYTRADVIRSPEVVDAFETAKCAQLSIGFESMASASLERMHKQVNARKNRRANELLADSEIDYRGSFMIGYPGETLAEYEETHRFLVDEYASNFILNPFTFIDETMPVWEDAEKYQLVLADPDDPDSAWSHIGMDQATARNLHRQTILDVRWKNDRAVPTLWQIPFDRPLIRGLAAKQNLRLEKLLERLAFVTVDFADRPDLVRAMTAEMVARLDRDFGVIITAEAVAA